MAGKNGNNRKISLYTAEGGRRKVMIKKSRVIKRGI